MNVKHFIFGAAVLVLLFIYHRGEEDRFVHYLKAQGYSDVQIEHPTQFRRHGRWTPYSYRARSPSGPPVHGGACVFYSIIETTEPIGKK